MKFKFGARTKKEESILEKKHKRSKAIYEMEIKNYTNLMDLAKKYSARDLIEDAIEGAKTKLDMIKFSLITQYENETTKATSLFEEGDPLLCIPMYIKSVRKQLIKIEELMKVRANEIILLRKKHKAIEVKKK